MDGISFTDRLTNLFNSSGNAGVVTAFLNLSSSYNYTLDNLASSPDDYESVTYSNYSNGAIITESAIYSNSTTALPPNVPTSVHMTPILTPRRSVLFQVFYSLVLFLFTVIGIKGNVGVIIVIWKDPPLLIKNQLSNLPILNLAIADLTKIVLVCLPAAIAVAKDEFPFSFIFCRIQSGVVWTATVASLCTMAIISIERYIAVKWTYRYKEWVTMRRLATACTISWIPGLLAGSYTVAEQKWVLFDYWTGVCELNWDASPDPYSWTVFSFVTLFAVPSILLLLINFVTLYIIQTNKNCGVRPKPKAPPRPRFLNTPDIDYFMRQKTFTPDLAQQQEQQRALGKFGPLKPVLTRKKNMRDTSPSVQALQMREELFTKVEEQASRIAFVLPEGDFDETTLGPQQKEGGEHEVDPQVLLKTMMIVVLVFVVCTAPTALWRFVKIISKQDLDQHWITSLAALAQFGASIANPIIYICCREDFRIALVKLGQCVLGSCVPDGMDVNEFH